MDEETWEHQKGMTYCVVRQAEQWWYDFGIMCKAVEKTGARPWIWSDYAWHHPDEFFAKMPQEVVQSNWYYGNDFTEKDNYHTFYEKFAMAGYDQIPAGSNWSYQENFKLTIDFVKRLPQEHILGFEQTVWFPTLNARMNRHEGAIQALAEAKQAYEAN